MPGERMPVASARRFATANPDAPKPGPCDRGEREIIRRRLVLSIIPKLAEEIGREPHEVAATIAEIAIDRYRRLSPIGGLDADADDIDTDGRRYARKRRTG